MYGYNNEELIAFIGDKFNGCSILDFSGEVFSGQLGQGIHRTTYYFPEYPDIVFKVGIGSEGTTNDSFEAEETFYGIAKKEGFAPFFSPVEWIGNIECVNEWYDDEENEFICNDDEKINIPVYIQPRMDWIFGDRDCFQEATSLSKEKKIASILEYGSRVGYSALSAFFIRKYGIDQFFNLSEFLGELGLEDLHNGNWGYKDGDLYIIDYAM